MVVFPVERVFGRLDRFLASFHGISLCIVYFCTRTRKPVIRSSGQGKTRKAVFIDAQPDVEHQAGQCSEIARRILAQNSFRKVTNLSGIDA